jgi:hypothetical protein
MRLLHRKPWSEAGLQGPPFSAIFSRSRDLAALQAGGQRFDPVRSTEKGPQTWALRYPQRG